MQEYIATVFLLRLIERFVLTGIILTIALVVLVAFWRTVHRIEFSVTKEKLGVAGATLIATPVLVLLILVGFSWVVLSNRILLQNGENHFASAGAAAGSSFSGAFSTEENVADTLLAFNCALSHIPDLSPRQQVAINRMKANEIIAHWKSDWGGETAKKQFWNWATKNDNSAAPVADLTQLFNQKDPQC